MSALRNAANSIAASAGDADEFSDLLIELAPEVTQYLANCPPISDAAPNPNAAATPAEEKAWNDACALKKYAGQATPHHVKKLAERIKHKKRKDGNPVTKAESLALAHGLVDQALDSPLEDMAAAVLESRQA